MNKKKKLLSPEPEPAAPGLTGGPLLLDIKGSARTLSTTVWAIRELLWAKKLPFIKLGRKFLIDPVDLRAFIQEQKAA